MPRIVMFGGGSGSRDITLALTRAGHALTRVVPAWDAGGSSRALRDALGMLAVGDIRQALMTLAHGEGRAGSVVRFFNARLSEAASPADLRAEFDFYAGGAHPLLASMARNQRAAVLDYLRMFDAAIDPAAFDLRRGSIGNFVLAGAWLAHRRDIGRAIRVFRALCGIRGNVAPSTTANDVQLHAELADGRIVEGQDRITALDAEAGRVGIRGIRLTCTGNGAPPPANPLLLRAVARADVLLFGPGSFFTSTLPHLAVAGVPEAIAATGPRVPKVLIGNTLECAETRGRTLAEMVAAMDAWGVAPTQVLAHRGHVPFERVVNGFRYLREGAPAIPRLLADDFEDPWHRGRHDAEKVTAVIGRLS